ncbi:probable WRKY transcription factor 14 [Phragmites australis]|uniref:probable WRKY transcription factor 14 n=1 Tax=Phragmites australis TaxID=29695 RepID=UPI002D78933B|nr:probable WRKY transcription factor 14 [Phragmites australis]XP_062222332.1 probable WRKY transcription factor 14 [Phragmites australis]
MCDYFLQRMEGDHQAGDLTDIIRAGGVMQAGVVEPPSTATGWQLLDEQAATGLFPPPQPSSSDGATPSGDGFGDSLSALPDSYFRSDYRTPGGAADFFDFETPVGGRASGGGACVLVDSGGGGVVPRGMQVPALSPRAIRPYPVMMDGDTVKLGMPTMMPGLAVGPPCAFDAVAGLQMPSPRTGGIKRRKNQVRKVVCIPAPAASAGGRSTGEVVPSDLWAWRKYGQKPIKGSPYPRGYYRCSSSKGCPARKQVERSRTDPSMLVITYNSEHNHPWPTQRNALAGSTRSHHAKSNGNNSSVSKNNSSHNLQKSIVKAEPDQTAAATAATSTTTTATTSTSGTPPTMAVKEEAMVGSETQKGIDHDTSVTLDYGDLLQQMFSQSYRPMIPEGGHHDDFFADLAELESDPMSLIFSKDYMETKPGGDPSKEKAAPKSVADPLFNMLDWATNAVATSAGSSFEQGESGL